MSPEQVGTRSKRSSSRAVKRSLDRRPSLPLPNRSRAEWGASEKRAELLKSKEFADRGRKSSGADCHYARGDDAWDRGKFSTRSKASDVPKHARRTVRVFKGVGQTASWRQCGSAAQNVRRLTKAKALRAVEASRSTE